MSRRTAPAAVRWTIYVAIAIVFAIACAFLSNWQFDRNASRSEQLALVAANYDTDPVPLADVIPEGGSLTAADQWQPVELTGTYLADQQLLVRNRAHGGTAAFEVLVPFQLDDGRILLINRGWVAPGSEQPEPDVVPAPPEGEVTVLVRMRLGEQLPASGRTAPDGQVPTINLPLVAGVVDPQNSVPMEQSAYGLMYSEDPAPATRPSAIDPPSEDPGPHLSYAIQWILFAVMGFIFIGYVIRSERKYRLEEAEERAASARAEAAGTDPGVAAYLRAAAPRRRDRDTEDEDELLDRTR